MKVTLGNNFFFEIWTEILNGITVNKYSFCHPQLYASTLPMALFRAESYNNSEMISCKKQNNFSVCEFLRQTAKLQDFNFYERKGVKLQSEHRLFYESLIQRLQRSTTKKKIENKIKQSHTSCCVDKNKTIYRRSVVTPLSPQHT